MNRDRNKSILFGVVLLLIVMGIFKVFSTSSPAKSSEQALATLENTVHYQFFNTDAKEKVMTFDLFLTKDMGKDADEAKDVETLLKNQGLQSIDLYQNDVLANKAPVALKALTGNHLEIALSEAVASFNTIRFTSATHDVVNFSVGQYYMDGYSFRNKLPAKDLFKMETAKYYQTSSSDDFQMACFTELKSPYTLNFKLPEALVASGYVEADFNLRGKPFKFTCTVTPKAKKEVPRKTLLFDILILQDQVDQADKGAILMTYPVSLEVRP